MQKITNKRKVREITVLFMILYFVSYITRINYSAVISEIVSSEGVAKSLAALALTASSVTYGIGQLISGFLGDRIEPKRVVLIGLSITIAMNLLIPECKSPYQMTAVWAVNGFAQAFMWPPIVKLMATLFSGEDYQKGTVIVSWGSSLGTIAVYLISPLCILLAGWRMIFFFAAVVAIVMIIIWTVKCPLIGVSSEKKHKNKSGKIPGNYILMLFVIMIGIVLQGVLRDGVSTWMPSYISETFNLDSMAAILSGVVLPIFGILTYQITSLIYRKMVKGELMLSGILFAICCFAAFMLFVLNGVSTACSVAFFALLNGCSHGINLILVCMIPPYFSRFGNISFISGLLNFCTYVGSSVSVYGVAVFSEKYSWGSTLLLWALVALAGALICLLFNKNWEKIKNATADSI